MPALLDPADIASVPGPAVAEAPGPGRLTCEPFAFQNPDENGIVRAELCRLAVPEKRRAHSSGVIELAYVRIPSTATRPGPPIVWLAGGPGDAGTDALKGPLAGLLLGMREHADVVVLDQRGTGLSRPVLNCPGFVDLPLEEPSAREKVISVMEGLARGCRRFWEARGVDLSAYNVNEMADDLEDLREALGAQRLTLVGASFGTHLALATIHRHEASVYRAILLGVVGPDHALALPSSVQKHLAEIHRLAGRDRRLSRRVPDLLGLMREVLERLEARPVTVEITDPKTKRIVAVTLGRLDLACFTRRLLYSRPNLEALPALYEAMSRGDFSALATLTLSSRRAPAPSAARFMAACAAGASPRRLRRIKSEKEGALLGDILDFPLPEVCSAWGIPDLGSGFHAPVRSGVPILLVSGSLDAPTPAGNAEEVLTGFPKGSHVQILGATHFCLGLAKKTRQILSRFLRGEGVQSARFTAPPFRFRLPAGEEGERWTRHGAGPSFPPAYANPSLDQNRSN